MKATIYNISVEGTPEEIFQLKKLIDTQNSVPNSNPNFYDWISPKWSESTCDTVTVNNKLREIKYDTLQYS